MDDLWTVRVTLTYRDTLTDGVEGDGVLHCKKEMVILTLLRLSQLQLNDIISPPTLSVILYS